MRILMVLTSHDVLGDTGKRTGLWLEEFAAPYYTFLDAGADITVASPAGGQPPLAPKSDLPDFQTPLTARFKADSEAQAVLAATVKLETMKDGDFDTVFYPGGHSPMWDLAESEVSIALIDSFATADKPIGLVWHLEECEGRQRRTLSQGPHRYGLHQWRRGSCGTDRCGAIPHRGHLHRAGRRLPQRPRLGTLRGAGRRTGHRPEPGQREDVAKALIAMIA
jgi:hypothetical protein